MVIFVSHMFIPKKTHGTSTRHLLPIGEALPTQRSLEEQGQGSFVKTHSNMHGWTSGIDLLVKKKKEGLGEHGETWELLGAETKLLLPFGVT